MLTMYEPIRSHEEEWRERRDQKGRKFERNDKNRDLEAALQISRPPPPSSPSPAAAAEKERLVSLDVFRGVTVALMVLVDDVGGIFPAINHSPWDGVTLADFVMPFFLFIVGVSLAFAYKNLACRHAATRKAILRSLKLLLLGLFLQGGFIHGLNNLTYGIDVEKIRFMGVLQRIAIAYLVAALCEIWLKGVNIVNSELSMIKKYRYHWVVASVIATVYILLLYGLYVPDWEYRISSEDNASTSTVFLVKCGVRGDTGPACNAVGMLDRMLLGIQHLYRKPIYARTKKCSIMSPNYGPLPPDAPSWCQAPFDPEGLLSSLVAVVTCLVGLHYGHIIVHFKDHKKRLNQWVILSSCLLMLGLALDLLGMRLNKPLYSFSYMCVTAGASGFLFSMIYLMVDVYGYRRAALVLEWMGIHALPIYILIACNVLFLVIQGFYWNMPRNNILRLVGIGK